MPSPRANTLDRLLTVKETAFICQVSIKTVRRWIEARELVAAKLGAQWRIRPKDLDLYVREHLEW